MRQAALCLFYHAFIEDDSTWTDVMQVRSTPGCLTVGALLRCPRRRSPCPCVPSAALTMGPRRWLTYLANVGSLSPVPKDIKFGEVPAGVKVLGGTYAIDGDAVRFAHMDEVPGATPEIEDVLAAVGA